MLAGLYSAASAMDSAAQRHDVIAHNLAHANHPGYRRHVPVDSTFESVMYGQEQAGSIISKLGTSTDEHYIDFTAGTFMQTGRKLDVALQGDGFFVVEGPQGPLYTRNGAFNLDSEGQIVTADGLTVTGSGGPIVLPPDTSLEQLSVSPDGQLSAGGQQIGQFEIVAFEHPDQLLPAGISLFQAPDDLQPDSSEALVAQGIREGSNVSPVLEMVRMIDGMRQYEAAARALQVISEAVQKNVSPQ